MSFRLRSYLMIETSGGFRLSSYLRDISGHVEIPSGQVIEFKEISLSYDSRYKCGVMLHDFWAWGIGRLDVIHDSIGKLRLDYHISFTGHHYEAPDYIELPVPLLARGTGAEQMGARWGEPRSDHKEILDDRRS